MYLITLSEKVSKIINTSTSEILNTYKIILIFEKTFLFICIV